MSDLLENLRRLGTYCHDDVSVALDAIEEIEQLHAALAEQAREIESLRAAVTSGEGRWVGHKELSSMRADAERYRWLRDECDAEKNLTHVWILQAPSEVWDAAIDAAKKPAV